MLSRDTSRRDIRTLPNSIRISPLRGFGVTLVWQHDAAHSLNLSQLCNPSKHPSDTPRLVQAILCQLPRLQPPQLPRARLVQAGPVHAAHVARVCKPALFRKAFVRFRACHHPNCCGPTLFRRARSMQHATLMSRPRILTESLFLNVCSSLNFDIQEFAI